METNKLCEKYVSSVYLDEKKGEPKNTGLFHGKAGEVMVLLFIHKHLGREDCFEKANLILDDIASHIDQVQDPGFMDGLSGIGWLIEWIAQNNFIEINTDEVLEEVDDQLYKTVLFSNTEDISVRNGCMGKALYFLIRHQSKNYKTHRYKTFCHEEGLVLLTDAMQKKLFGKKGGLTKGLEQASIEIKQIGDALLFLTDLSKTGINGSVVEECIYKLVEFVQGHISKINTMRQDPHLEAGELFYLSYCYWKAGGIFKCRFWQEEGQDYLLSYLKKNSSFLRQEEPNIPLLNVLIDLHSQIKTPETATIIEQWSDTIYYNEVPRTLYNGLGSVVLSKLHLKYDRKNASYTYLYY